MIKFFNTIDISKSKGLFPSMILKDKDGSDFTNRFVWPVVFDINGYSLTNIIGMKFLEKIVEY